MRAHPSQIMCVGKAASFCVGSLMIARRYIYVPDPQLGSSIKVPTRDFR